MEDSAFSPLLDPPKAFGEAELHPDFKDQIGAERTNQGPGDDGPPWLRFYKSKQENHEKDRDHEKTKDVHKISVKGQSYEYKKNFVPADLFRQTTPQVSLPPSVAHRFQNERNRHDCQKDPEP